MKRFALKRITALVLALIMTLSLLPMTVWAEDETTGAPSNTVFTDGGDGLGGDGGMYIFTKLSDDANGNATVLTCDIPAAWAWDEENNKRYVHVACDPIAPTTVYIAVESSHHLKIGETNLTALDGTWNTNYKVYPVAVPTQEGFMSSVEVTHIYDLYNENGGPAGTATGQIDLVFDFTPVLTAGDALNLGDFYLFTDLSDGVLTSDRTMSAQGHDNGARLDITVPCSPASEAPENVYLAVLEWQKLNMTDVTMVGKWNTMAHWNNTQEVTYNIYSIAVTEPTTGDTAIKSGTYTYYDNEIESYKTCELNLIFDFTPIFTLKEDGGKDVGDCGVRFFTVLDSTNKTLYCGDTVQQDGNRITVSCPKASNATVYMTADGELFVNDTKQEPAVSGKWMADDRACKIYALTVSNPGNNSAVSYTVSHGGGSIDLIFDFAPVLNGSNPADVAGVQVFTDLDSNGNLSCKHPVSAQWKDGGFDIVVTCYPESTAPKKVYLAMYEGETLEIDGATNIGKWTTQAHWDETQTATYNIYAVDVTKPETGYVVKHDGTHSWTDDENKPCSEECDLIFDFTPVLTGAPVEGFWGMRFFADLKGSELSYNGEVQQWGDMSGVYVTVYCAPETSKTIYLGIDPQNTVTIDGTELTNMIGKWSTQAEWNPEETITYNIYPLTVSKPANSDTVEYEIVRSYDWYDDNNTPDDNTDDTSGTERETFTLVFDFANYPSDPLFVKDGEDYYDFANVFSGFDNDWELYYCQWDDATETESYHLFGNRAFTFEATDANGKDCSTKFSWNNDGTLHFDGETFVYDDLPITLFVKDDTGYRHKLVIEDNYYSDWDRSCWKTYTTNVVTEGDYTYGGCSTITVQLTPEQAQFIDLPDKLTADNELVITVHDPGEEMWRALVSQAEEFEGISVFYQPGAKVGLKDGELPQMKYVGGPWTAVEFLELLYRDNYPIEKYGAGGNGNIYGKVFHETDRTVIIPEASAIRSTWIWVYDDGTQLADSVNVKVVLADDVGGAVTLEEGQSGKTVDLSRVEVMEREGFALAFEKKDGALVYEDGVLTYRYVGPTEIEDPEFAGAFPTTVADFVVRDTAMKVGLISDMEETPDCELLTVHAPKGYKAKALDGHPCSGDSMKLWYCWEGLAVVWTYTLTWVNDAGEEYVEHISIETPSVEGAEWWMDHMYGGTIKKVDAERMLVTELTKDCGAEYQLSDGLAYVQYDNDKELDVSAIKDAVISVQAPENADGDLPVAYRGIWWDSGSQDDPTYNRFCEDIIAKLEGQVEVIDRLEPGENNETITTATNALLKQTIGDIEYYYSGDRGTRLLVVKWIYDEVEENNGAVYEYLRMDTSPYYCTLEAKVSTDVNGAVDKPTAEVDESATGHSNIYLETRIHPQEDKGGKYGQYFFELRLVDGEGNTYVEYHEDGYTIILPYSFMGEEWNYEMAKNLKEKPIINHYDKNFNLKENNGAIKGEYTERGIEFKVGDFSPFMLTWDETIADNTGAGTTPPTGGTPGGYYPIVTPTTPVEKPTETKPTTPAQPVAPPAEVTVPVSGDENTINVEASVSGSTATIDKVDMTKLEGVIGDDVAVGTVTIDFSDLKSSEGIDTVEIPADVVKEIAEAVADPNNDAESLEIVLSDGASIEFDAAALAEKVSQAGGADITISIKQAVENVLSAAQQAAVGDRVAFDINVTSGGVHISDMGGKITIHAPYELRDGETAEGIVVYYVDDEGNKEKCETSYDSVKKRVNWKTDHLSVYMIAHEAPVTDDDPAVDNTPADEVVQPDNSNSVGLWIGVALAVLVVAIIVVVILIKRKKA